MLSRTEHMIDCPDCLCGLVVAVIAAWLSVYMVGVYVTGGVFFGAGMYHVDC